MSAADAAASLLAALAGTTGIKQAVTIDQASALTAFPAAVLDLPDLDWTNTPYNSALPSMASFQVAVVVKASGYALAELEAAVTPVLQSLWDVQDAVVTEAKPGIFPIGGAQLPAYNLVCEVTL